MSFEYKKQLEAMRKAVLDKGDTKFKTPSATELRVSSEGLMRRQVDEGADMIEKQSNGLGLTIASALAESSEDLGSIRPKARPEPVRPRARFDSYKESDGFTRTKNKLIDRGMPSHIAEAFAYNFKDESNFQSGVNEANPIVKGSRGGYGLYQLTGPRRKAYEKYADDLGVPYSDEDAQLDFLMMELAGSERSAWNKIQKSTDVSSAAVSIVNNFLRPAKSHRSHRAKKYSAIGY